MWIESFRWIFFHLSAAIQLKFHVWIISMGPHFELVEKIVVFVCVYKKSVHAIHMCTHHSFRRYRDPCLIRTIKLYNIYTNHFFFAHTLKVKCIGTIKPKYMNTYTLTCIYVAHPEIPLSINLIEDIYLWYTQTDIAFGNFPNISLFNVYVWHLVFFVYILFIFLVSLTFSISQMYISIPFCRFLELFCKLQKTIIPFCNSAILAVTHFVFSISVSVSVSLTPFTPNYPDSIHSIGLSLSFWIRIIVPSLALTLQIYLSISIARFLSELKAK